VGGKKSDLGTPPLTFSRHSAPSSDGAMGEAQLWHSSELLRTLTDHGFGQRIFQDLRRGTQPDTRKKAFASVKTDAGETDPTEPSGRRLMAAGFWSAPRGERKKLLEIEIECAAMDWERKAMGQERINGGRHNAKTRFDDGLREQVLGRCLWCEIQLEGERGGEDEAWATGPH